MHDNAFAMQIRERFEDDSSPCLTSFTFSEDSMLLLYKGCIYVPDYCDVRLAILRASHDHLLVGHPGIHKTIHLVTRRYYWPGLTTMVKSYVGSCVVCARAKPSHHAAYGPLKFLSIPKHPWNSISMDFITGLPLPSSSDSILVIVDQFTKMGLFTPTIMTLTAKGLADLVITWVVVKHGTPADIVSDRSSLFISNFWMSLTKRLGIKLNLSTAYHPKTDGQTKHLNQILEQYLRIYVDYLQDDWVLLLPLAEFAYNNAVHSATNISPFFMNKGFHPNLEINIEAVPSTEANQAVLDLRDVHNYIHDQLTITQCQYEQLATSARPPFPMLNMGDQVWLNTCNIKTKRLLKKLDHKKLGPFPVTKKVSTHAYHLGLPHAMNQLHNVFHVCLLKPTHPDPFPNHIQPPPPPIEIDGKLEYEITEIVDSKIDRHHHGKGLIYCVR
jgi:Integrase zinc binding domain